MNISLSRKINIGIILALMMLIGVTAFSIRGGTALYYNSQTQSKSYDILDHVDRLYSSMQQAESGQRGYLFTGEDRYLDQYDSSIEQARKEEGILSGMTLNSREEELLVRDLKPIISSKFDEMDQTISLRKKQGFNAAQSIVLTDLGKELMEKIQTNLERIRIEEKNILDQSGITALEATRNNFYYIIFGNVIALIVFVGASITINRDITRQKEAEAKLNKRTEELEAVEKNLEKANASLDQQVAGVEEKNKELEDSKNATVNILEDLELTKGKIEQERVKDEAILQSIGDGTIIANEDGVVVRVNGSAEQLLGRRSETMLGHRFFEIVSATNTKGTPLRPEDYPLMQSLTSGKTISRTLNYSKSELESFSANTTATPIILGGKIIGAIEIIRDYTKEKEIDQAKTEFVSLASHQLRTPLSTIGWYAELLLSGDAGEVTEQQKQFLQEIYHGNKRMVDLVNALLNVSRIELGTFVIDPTPVNFAEIAQTVLKELQPMIKQMNLHITEKYDPDVPTISADKNLARIIIQNLLSNAVKYSKDDGSVEVAIERGQGEVIVVRVSDNGLGIPQAQQDKVYMKLFRADNVREKDTDGTGLGLYIVKSILDHVGGTIRFESKENEGTTFYVTFPISGMTKKQGTRSLA